MVLGVCHIYLTVFGNCHAVRHIEGIFRSVVVKSSDNIHYIFHFFIKNHNPVIAGIRNVNIAVVCLAHILRIYKVPKRLSVVSEAAAGNGTGRYIGSRCKMDVLSVIVIVGIIRQGGCRSHIGCGKGKHYCCKAEGKHLF